MTWLDLPLHELPGIFSVDVEAPPVAGDPIRVSVLLKGYRRADVAKWAAHFGSALVEGEPEYRPISDRWERDIRTVHETRGFRVTVRTTVLVKAPAAAPAEKHPDEFGELTIECAKPVHWAIDGRAACRTGSLSDPMTRVASGATCGACRALIPGGAS